MSSAAIYYQKSKVVQEEFKLIELTTCRELDVEKLKSIIDEVKEERRQLDDETILETFTLFNRVRSSTINLIKAISIWQESFTSAIRPTLMECDYIVEKMIKYIDLVNGSKVKKLFNFQFFRGNVLLLPYPNQKTVPPMKVNAALGEQIHLFSCPNEEEIIFCYQFLINCLPDDIYKSKVVSLNNWLISPWIPRVWISEAMSKFSGKSAPVTTTHRGISGRNNNRDTLNTQASSANGAAKGGGRLQRANSAASKISKSTPRHTSPSSPTNRSRTASMSSTNVPPPPSQLQRTRTNSSISRTNNNASTPTSPHGSPLVSSRKAMPISPTSRPAALTLHNPGRRDSTSSKDNKGRKSPKSPTKLPVIARRNQMLRSEADKLLAMTGNMTDEMKESLKNKNEVEAVTAEIDAEEARELEKLDLYYKEMSNLFVPKFNRRAVQTMALNGVDLDNLADVTDFQYKSNKVFYLHTTQAAKEVLENVVQSGTQSEKFTKTDGKLIAKRNRIIADRNAALKETNHKDYAGGSTPKSVGKHLLDKQVNETDSPLPFIANDDGESEDETEASTAATDEFGERVLTDAEGGEAAVLTGGEGGGGGGNRYRANTAESALSSALQSGASSPHGMLSRQNTSRKMSAASRRMSDLTVTFSVLGTDESGAASRPISSSGGLRPLSGKKHGGDKPHLSPVKKTATAGHKSPTKSGEKGSPPPRPPLTKGPSTASMDINSITSSPANSVSTGSKPPLERSGSSVKIKKVAVRATENFTMSTAQLRTWHNEALV